MPGEPGSVDGVRQLRPWAASGWRTRRRTSASASTAGATWARSSPTSSPRSPRRSSATHVRRRQTELFVDMGVIRPHEATGPTVSTGVFGGYLYMNASAMRLFGVRMPGMTPAHGRGAGDRHGRGAAALPAAEGRPEPRGHHRDLAAELQPAPPPRPREPRRSLAARREAWAGDDARPRRARRTPSCSRGSTPTRRASGRACGGCSSRAWSAPRRGRILEQLVEPRRGATPGSGEPDRRGHRRRRLRAAGPPPVGARPPGRRATPTLTAAFDAGLDDIAGSHRRHRRSPDGIDAFLRDHGHRGNDEYELASPAWVMDPAPGLRQHRPAPARRRTIAIPSVDRRAAASRRRRRARRGRAARRRGRCAGWCGGPPRSARLGEHRPRAGQGHPRAARTWRPDGCCTSWCAGPPSAAGPTTRGSAFCVTIDELPRYVEAPGDVRRR